MYYVVCIDTPSLSVHVCVCLAIDYSPIALVSSFHCYIVFHHRIYHIFMPLGIYHFFPITSSGTIISMNICAYVLSGWTLEAELLGYEECTFSILIDTNQFPEGQYQFTLPPASALDHLVLSPQMLVWTFKSLWMNTDIVLTLHRGTYTRE